MGGNDVGNNWIKEGLVDGLVDDILEGLLVDITDISEGEVEATVGLSDGLFDKVEEGRRA